MVVKQGRFFIVGAVLHSTLSACGVSRFVSVDPDATTIYSGDQTPIDSSDSDAKPDPNAPIDSTKDPLLSPPDTILYFDKTVSAVSERKPISLGKLHLKIDNAIVEEKTENVVEKPPLSIVFAVDRSSSMGAELNVVKTGIQSFSDKLISSGFSAEFGAVAFQDKVDSFQNPNTFDSFKTYINTISLAPGEGNADIPEGSLAALEAAVELLEKKVTASDVVPIVVLLTDAIGHRGGGGLDIRNRDCVASGLVDRFQTEFGKRIIFFHASSGMVARTLSYVRARCPWAKVSDQYNEILKSLESSTPMTYRGQALPWPFDEAVLTNQLPNILVNKLSTKKSTCEMMSAELSVDGQLIKSWSRAELSVDASGAILLPEAVSALETMGTTGKAMALKVNRCCDSPVAGGKCSELREQNVSFSVEAK